MFCDWNELDQWSSALLCFEYSYLDGIEHSQLKFLLILSKKCMYLRHVLFHHLDNWKQIPTEERIVDRL